MNEKQNAPRKEYFREYHRRSDVIERKKQYQKDVGMVSVSFKTYDIHLRKLKQFATQRGIGVSTLIKLALEEYCDIDLSKPAADELKTEIDTQSE